MPFGRQIGIPIPAIDLCVGQKNVSGYSIAGAALLHPGKRLHIPLQAGIRPFGACTDTGFYS